MTVAHLDTTEPGFALRATARLRDYGALLKPRVMSLVVFTAIVGLVVAPGAVDLQTAITAIVATALGAGGAGALNMWYDRDIDALMARTRLRPLPAQRVTPREALALGLLLSGLSIAAMALWVNGLAAGLLALTIAFYAVVYTMWLKRRTVQNIVIGGAAGAFPPVIGWAAATGEVGLPSLALFAIIFAWTPPHFWALALVKAGEYARAGVPMLPVVRGRDSTRRHILAYSLVLAPIALSPVALGAAGWVYGAAASILSALLLLGAWLLYRARGQAAQDSHARRLFAFSILYLLLLFLALLADHGLAA